MQIEDKKEKETKKNDKVGEITGNLRMVPISELYIAGKAEERDGKLFGELQGNTKT